MAKSWLWCRVALVISMLPLVAAAQDTFNSTGTPSMSAEQARRCASDRVRHYADEPFKQPSSCPQPPPSDDRSQPPGTPPAPSRPPGARTASPSKPSSPVATLPGVGTKPCVQPSDFADADAAVANLPQTSKSGTGSFNCFYYVRTVVEGARPKDLGITTASGLTNWGPETTYIDEAYLRAHRYYLLTKRSALTGDRDSYQPGDIILVPGRDSTLGGVLAGNQRYTHAAVVRGTRGGRITRIRQKVDPFSCVVDLTPAEFAKVYAPQSVGGETAVYSVWRRAR